jgi:hypothetical protein
MPLQNAGSQELGDGLPYDWFHGIPRLVAMRNWSFGGLPEIGPGRHSGFHYLTNASKARQKAVRSSFVLLAAR